MIRLNEVGFGGNRPVDGYGPGFFRVGGEVFRGAVLITPESVALWGGYDEVAPLVALAGRIDVLFLGTGRDMARPPAAFREALQAAGIGVEHMDSAAAARSYNVVLAEGRRIAAALLPVT